MGEEAGCNALSVMEVDASGDNGKQPQAKENGHAAAAVDAADGAAAAAAAPVPADPRLQAISDAIRVVPDFPKPGSFSPCFVPEPIQPAPLARFSCSAAALVRCRHHVQRHHDAAPAPGRVQGRRGHLPGALPRHVHPSRCR